ncbi:MAG: hypothetical protein ACPG4N_01675 [Gammaproteobacteria bacterium]
MRLFKWLFLLLILTVVVVPPLLVFMAVQPSPLVSAQSSLSPETLSRAERLLRLHDPRQLSQGEERELEISEEDLNVLARYALQRANAGSVLIDLQPGYISAYLTWALPDNPLSDHLGRYLNAAMDLTPSEHALHVDHFRLGGLTVPRSLAQPFIHHGHDFLSGEPVYQAILAAIRQVNVNDRNMRLVYRWDEGLVDQVKQRGWDMLVSKQDVARVSVYLEAIEGFLRGYRGPEPIPLEDLLDAVFMRALEESLQGDPVAENRAAILAAAMVVPESKIGRLLGLSLPENMPRKRFSLDGREDFSQHFLISAGLTLAGDRSLADAVGLYKEIDDSQGGSGFSFTDLAADRAGVRFAERAVESAAQAERLQSIMSSAPPSSVFMPKARDLPEFLSKAEFEARFGGVGQPAYQAVADQIEQRIADLRIHQ